MIGNHEIVSVDEYAHRYGWRKSAVIHRIRSGVYDGYKANGKWYVVRNVDQPNTALSEGCAEVPLGLPWKTVPGPLLWVTIVLWLATLSMLYVGSSGKSGIMGLVIGIGLSSFSFSIIYEAFRTGTIRARYFSCSFINNPVQFFLLVGTYAMLGIAGLIFLIKELNDWIRAA